MYESKHEIRKKNERRKEKTHAQYAVWLITCLTGTSEEKKDVEEDDEREKHSAHIINWSIK